MDTRKIGLRTAVAEEVEGKSKIGICGVYDLHA